MLSILLVVGVAGCLAIVLVGTRFLLSPTGATRDFGVTPGHARALTAIKGVRDITSGVVPLVAWAAGGHQVFGWVLLAAALTPMADAIIVLANRGTSMAAFAIHAPTALVLVVVGVLLARA